MSVAMPTDDPFTENGNPREKQPLLNQNNNDATKNLIKSLSEETASGPHAACPERNGAYRAGLPSGLSDVIKIDQKGTAFSAVECADAAFHVASLISILIWLALIAGVYLLTPETRFFQLETSQVYTAIIAASFLLISLLVKILPVFMRGGIKSFSGILTGAIVVQSIAMCTNILMVFLPCPILIDPVTLSQVYPFRYCEWTALAFVMTFFTEGMDMMKTAFPHEGNMSTKEKMMWYWAHMKGNILISVSMGVSTFMGYLFPYCPGFKSWMMCMVISWVLYLALFPRLHWKFQVLKGMSGGEDWEQVERFKRKQLSFRLLVTCAVCWTALVGVYCFGAFAHWFVPDGSIFKNKALPFYCDAFMDVIAKSFYMDVIVDIHSTIFDDAARATRRLYNLRRMMTAVWDNSSDIIVLSVRNGQGTLTTMISPTFHKIESIHNCDKTMPIIFEMKEDYRNINQHIPIDESLFFLESTQGRMYARSKVINSQINPYFFSLHDIIRKGWTMSNNEDLPMPEMQLRNGKVVHTDVKITQLGSNARLVVLRDVSERYRIFEAEKIAIAESTARKKDEEANRFTRHEVKNGILASIGVCEALGEKMAELHGPKENDTKGQNHELQLLAKELDSTLKDVLNTILSENMAREVIHGIYKPRMERVNVQSVLGAGGERAFDDSFPFITDPYPLPNLSLDPQLLKFIHRNAVSNACKYGKSGGVVITELRYLKETKEVVLDVINLPGEGHADFIALGEKAESSVFFPGNRLHGADNKGISAVSAGDGAWIAQKCAKTLEGQCKIRFEPNRTVFTFRCPASTYCSPDGVPFNFSLPKNTWGIAIDDSKLQRKLMQRFFSMAGIRNSQQVLLGCDEEEIYGFADIVVNLVKKHTNCYFLVIADENLDISTPHHTVETVSGSLSVQKLRQQLGGDLESRVLALVRSANDSAADIELYSSRAHGSLCKTSIKKDKIMEILAPLWVDRFADQTDYMDTYGELPDDDTDYHDAVVVQNEFTATKLMRTLEAIDALCIQEKNLLPIRWPLILKKLEVVKFNLQSLDDSDVAEPLNATNDVMTSSIDDDFVAKWTALRSVIIRFI